MKTIVIAIVFQSIGTMEPINTSNIDIHATTNMEEPILMIFQEHIRKNGVKYIVSDKFQRSIRCLKFLEILLELTGNSSLEQLVNQGAEFIKTRDVEEPIIKQLIHKTETFYLLKKSRDEDRVHTTTAIESPLLRKILVLSAIKDVLFWIKDGGNRIDRTIDIYGFSSPLIANLLGFQWHPEDMKNRCLQYGLFLKTIDHDPIAIRAEDDQWQRTMIRYSQEFYQEKEAIMGPITSYEGHDHHETIAFLESQYERIALYDLVDLYYISPFHSINKKPIAHYLYDVTENISKIIAILRFQNVYDQWLRENNIYQVPWDHLEHIKNDFMFCNYNNGIQLIGSFNNPFIEKIIKTYKKSYDHIYQGLMVKDAIHQCKRLAFNINYELATLNGDLMAHYRTMAHVWQKKLMDQKDDNSIMIHQKTIDNIFKHSIVLLRDKGKILTKEETISLKNQLTQGVNIYKILLSLGLKLPMVIDICQQLILLI